MTNIYDAYGARLDCTVIRIANCHVVHLEEELVKKGFGKQEEEYVRVLVGAGIRKEWKTIRWQL